MTAATALMGARVASHVHVEPLVNFALPPATAGCGGATALGGGAERIPITVSTVAGQVAVMGTENLWAVSLVPDDAQPPPLAIERILGADQVVIGPGSLFTSVLAAVSVHGIAEAVDSSKAQVVYVCNLRPQVPETQGFDVGAHVAALARHNVTVDVVVCDSIQGMAIGATDVAVHDVPLTGENRLVHSPARLAEALASLLG